MTLRSKLNEGVRRAGNFLYENEHFGLGDILTTEITPRNSLMLGVALAAGLAQPSFAYAEICDGINADLFIKSESVEVFNLTGFPDQVSVEEFKVRFCEYFTGGYTAQGSPSWSTKWPAEDTRRYTATVKKLDKIIVYEGTDLETVHEVTFTKIENGKIKTISTFGIHGKSKIKEDRGGTIGFVILPYETIPSSDVIETMKEAQKKYLEITARIKALKKGILEKKVEDLFK